MNTTELLRIRRDRILQLAAEHGAHNVRVLGAGAPGDEQPDDDIEFLVEMECGRNVRDAIELGKELERLLERKVDILRDADLSPYVEHCIHGEAVPL
ncbi:nucleotidyltransferase family protein [Nitrospira sp. Nam74]